MTKEKTKIGKLLSGKLVQNVLAPFVRSAVKQVPVIGTPLVEIVSNITGAKRLDAVTGAVVPKHNYLSIIIQGTIAVALIIAIYTKTITIYQLIEIAKQFLPQP